MTFKRSFPRRFDTCKPYLTFPNVLAVLVFYCRKHCYHLPISLCRAVLIRGHCCTVSMSLACTDVTHCFRLLVLLWRCRATCQYLFDFPLSVFLPAASGDGGQSAVAADGSAGEQSGRRRVPGRRREEPPPAEGHTHHHRLRKACGTAMD